MFRSAGRWLHHGILLLGVLATGCRAQQNAFYFRPVPPELAPPAAAGPLPEARAALAVLPPALVRRVLQQPIGRRASSAGAAAPPRGRLGTAARGPAAPHRVRGRAPRTAPALRGGDVRDFLSLLALAGGVALWVVVGGWAGAGLFALSLLVILGIMIWGFGRGDMP